MGTDNADTYRYCSACGAELKEAGPLRREDVQEVVRQLMAEQTDTRRLAIEIIEAARERLVNWLKLALIPVIIILAIAGFLGIRELTDLGKS